MSVCWARLGKTAVWNLLLGSAALGASESLAQPQPGQPPQTSRQAESALDAPVLSQVDRAGLLRWTAALSDERPSVHNPAIGALQRYGVTALPELSVLARDSQAGLRLRVTVVLAGIPHSRAVDMLELLASDGNTTVREAAMLGLSRQSRQDDRVLARLRDGMVDPAPEVREAAALAMGYLRDPAALETLTKIPSVGGQEGRLRLPLGAEGDRLRERIVLAMEASLQSLVQQPSAVSEIQRLFTALSGPQLLALVDASRVIGDTRLAPALSQLLAPSYHVDIRVAAAKSLIQNGDSRAVPALVELASLAPQGNNWRLAEAASQTLRILTGHQAAPGGAWRLWWQDQAATVQGLHRRDAFFS